MPGEHGADAPRSDEPLAEAASSRSSLRELAGLFLKLGTVAFGGPAVHIAMMEDEVVRKRAWLSRERVLDLLGAANLIPGPNSTELVTHIGHARAGWPGLLVAGSCFIAPAMLIVLAISWAYVRFGALPQVQGVLYGVKPVVIAVVLQAIWGLGRTALKTRTLAVVGATSLALVQRGAHVGLPAGRRSARVAVQARVLATTEDRPAGERRDRGGAEEREE
jgi:chromate transporter